MTATSFEYNIPEETIGLHCEYISCNTTNEINKILSNYYFLPKTIYYSENCHELRFDGIRKEVMVRRDIIHFFSGTPDVLDFLQNCPITTIMEYTLIDPAKQTFLIKYKIKDLEKVKGF